MLRFRDLRASCFGLRFRVLRFRNYRLPSCECDYKMYLNEYTHFAGKDNANLLVHYYAQKGQILLSFFKTDRHHGYLTVLFGRITMPFLKNTTSVPLFFVILQCFLLYVSFLSVSVLFGNVLYSFIRRHSDNNGLATKGAEATTRTMATTTTTATTTAESNRLD